VLEALVIVRVAPGELVVLAELVELAA